MTRLRAVRPHFTQKFARVSTSAPLRRFPQPSLQRRHTPSGVASPLHPKNSREFPPMQPRFKGPTVTRRFFSHTCSRDTRLWAVRPDVSQKNAKVSTSPPTVQRSHRNTSLSSAFPTAETHAFGRCVPTSPQKMRVSTSPTKFQKVPP